MSAPLVRYETHGPAATITLDRADKRNALSRDLIAQLDAHRAHILGEGTLQERRGRNLRNEVLAIATARMRRRLEDELREDANFKRLLGEVVERRLDPASAATALATGGE